MKQEKIKYLHEFFEMQVDSSPDEIALIFKKTRVSYKELEDQANQLARYIKQKGVGPGDLVGIYLERSVRHIIAILAVLKTGAGYVPIDTSYPKERVLSILDDSKPELVVSEELAEQDLSKLPRETLILMDADAEKVSKQQTERLTCEETGVKPDDIAYVIYTSGTTGRPKGVVTEHLSVVNFVRSFNMICGVTKYDRVYHGFSVGFDGSIEEMWLAFSNGASLVVGTKDIVHLGNEVAKLLVREKVTVFSTVPTLLSLIAEQLPTVKLLIVSGEQCSRNLVDKWACEKRRMLNVYGPTETTVNATVFECVSGEPVTIGKPLPTYDICILDEKLSPVGSGKQGELYIGGRGVAREYLNQPKKTMEKFVNISVADKSPPVRLFRTGDMVRMNDRDELLFLGRVDTQIKIRGYRVELEEIEAVLMELPEIRSSVVAVVDSKGEKELAAYIILKNNVTVVAQDNVLEYLKAKLPVYMVPKYLEEVTEFPVLSSGKIDRKKLPKPQNPLIRTDRKIIKPSNKLEVIIAGVWEKVFKISPVSVDDDFFLDLGGYSLLAAQVVSLLRNEWKIQEAAVQDVYLYPTIRKFAEQLKSLGYDLKRKKSYKKQGNEKKETDKNTKKVSVFTRWCCNFMQIVSIYLFYGLFSIPGVVIVTTFLGFMKGAVSIVVVVKIWLLISFLIYPILLITSILVKWIVIGRYKPGKYPLWGWYYFRWWLATRIQSISGVSFLSGTPFMSLYYRLMGARVGSNCLIDTSQCAIYDLVKIGDDTCIGSETQILGCRIEDGMLLIGNITIGNRCFVGIHCSVGLNAEMGDDSSLDDMSLLVDEQSIGRGKGYKGSPSSVCDVKTPDIDVERSDKRHPFLFGLIHLLLIEFLGVFLFVLTVLPGIIIFYFLLKQFGLITALASVFITVQLSYIWFCYCVVFLKTLILKQSKPGVYPTESIYFLRKWVVDILMETSRGLLHTLYTTIYLPPWLRLLGAKIGRCAEISTVSQVSPDLVLIDDESFFADGAIVGGRHFFRGHVEFSRNRIGHRSFVGNNAILPIGKDIGSNSLLGVLSSSPHEEQTIPDGTEWLGSPSFKLPFRKKIQGFKDEVIYKPTLKLYILRYIIDGLRIIIPNLILAAGFGCFFLFIFNAYGRIKMVNVYFLMPFVAFGIAVFSALCTVAVKWVFMGKIKPVIKPLWSVYVWFNELVNGTYETVGAPALAPLLGTPFYAYFLRLMGCRIGKYVFMGTTLFSEFDLVEVGDNAVLNSGVVVQNHLFEDRIMKSDYLTIEAGCSVGNMAIVLYDTKMQSGSTLGPLSLLMKGEILPKFTQWYGIPSRQNDNKEIFSNKNKQGKIRR